MVPDLSSSKTTHQNTSTDRQQSLAGLLQQCLVRCTSSAAKKRRPLPSAFPVLDLPLHPIHRHVYEANLRNSTVCRNKYVEFIEKVKKGGGTNAIARHTQRNKKLLVRERLRLLLDDEDFLELSPFAGLGLPYGDIPSAGCLTGQKSQTTSLSSWY